MPTIGNTITKADAILALGGSVSSAAAAIGITSQAMSQWPSDGPLPPFLRDRVQAAIYRRQRRRARRGDRAEEAAPQAAEQVAL